MGRLVFVDVDGTLLDGYQRVPDSARRALATAVAGGHRLLLATGRSLPEIYPRLWELGFSGLLGGGGGYGRIGETVLFDVRVPADVIASTTDYLRGIGAAWVWQGPEGIHPSTSFMQGFTGGSGDAAGAPGDWDEYARTVAPHLHTSVPTTSAKCTFVVPPGGPSLEEVARRVAGHFTLIPGSVDSGVGTTGELIPVGVDKGVGLVRVAEALGVPLADTVALGDSDNDLEMLRVAGVGVAMGGAAPHVRAAANLVTAPLEEDGLAKAFATLGLV